MESLESNNFYNLGTTLTTGHLTKLHLAFIFAVVKVYFNFANKS